MNLSAIARDSILLLVTGWGVLLVAAAGCAAAAVALGLRALRSRLSAGRSHQLFAALFALSIAIPAALMLLSPATQSLDRIRTASAAMAVAPVNVSPTIRAVAAQRADTSPRGTLAAENALGVRALAVLWLALVVAAGVRLAGGLWLVRRIRRRSRPCGLAAVNDVSQRVSMQLGLSARVPVRESDDIGAPVSAGWWHPLVLLPAGLVEALSASHLELVLTHELSHVRRRDYLTNVLQSVGDLLTWHSPAHRWLSSEARRLREEACDDEVIAFGADPCAYAHALERLAGLSHGREETIPVCAANRNVAQRVERLLAGRGVVAPSVLRTGTAGTLLVLGIAATAVLTAASEQSVSRAAVRRSQLTGAMVANPMAHGARELETFPTGWAIRQDGSPVRIEDTNPSSAFVFQTVTVKNIFPKGITSVTFGAFIDSQGARRVSLTRSNPVGAAIEPGQSQILAADLFPVERVREVRALGSRGLLMLGVLEVTFDDGTRWTASLDGSATSFNAALGIPKATVPRSYISPSAPPLPPGGHPVTLCYYGESEIDVTSEGGVMEIASEPGNVATCINGRWVEGYHSVGHDPQ